MPAIAKKLLIAATSDGLLIRTSGDSHEHTHDVRFSYGKPQITQVPRDDTSNHFSSSSLEAYGIAGLLDLVTTSHLILITRNEQVASIRGEAIYAVRGVTLIPLTSRGEAERAVSAAQQKIVAETRAGAATEIDDAATDGGDGAETASVASADEDEHHADEAAIESHKDGAEMTSPVAKVGGFAQRWFGKGGSQAKGKGEVAKGAISEEPSSSAVGGQSNQGDENSAVSAAAPGSHAPEPKSTVQTLTPRILRAVKLYFSKSGFYYALDYNLSESLAKSDGSSSESPLWKRFDNLYFWNRHLVDPLVNAGCDELILPLMQGFVAQKTFTIEETKPSHEDVTTEPTAEAQVVLGSETPATTEDRNERHKFLLTLISRRSVKRAGLRYMRRGVDDDGNVANTVETEQLLSPLDPNAGGKTFSLVQLRGSIPLHFYQNPALTKPTPVIFGSNATNDMAFKKHLTDVAARYGRVQMVSLIDKHGGEATIGEAFEKHSKTLNENGGIDGSEVGFEWFDFHHICRGMKFENISVLLDALEGTLKSFGWTTKAADSTVHRQTGVVRTNCMDCLDRTNVVQSVIAGWGLEQQLQVLGLHIDLKSDAKTQWFNNLWADNGDAMSRQYAGTSALKGDFTRTRKRGWAGQLKDVSLTLTRYYNNMFGDYFMQTCIDFILGNEGPAVWDDFETDMMSKDTALDIRRLRQNAIDTCEKIVLEDPNDGLLAGWTLSCPKQSNTLRSLPFEECVALLTKSAFYLCRVDWETEKVGSFEKVDLQDLIELRHGAYITSALGGTHLDEEKNYGFVLRYKTTGKSIIRRNTRSLQNESEPVDEHEGKTELEKQATPAKENTRMLAFKALPPKSSAARDDGLELEKVDEKELVKHICLRIREAVDAVVSKEGEGKPEDAFHVEEKDVISVADAKKNTGYVESIGYSLKKLVW